MNMQPRPLKGDQNLASKVFALTGDLLRFELDITKALGYSMDSHSFDDIVSGVLSGRYHFYVHNRAFIVAELVQYPKHTIYNVFLAGGLMEDLLEMQEMIRPAAKALGAKYAALTGRHGWVKVLKDRGWSHEYSIMYAEV